VKCEAKCYFLSAGREKLSCACIFLHLFQLVLKDDGLIDQMLEIWVVGGKQLELDVIIESLEKHVLLLLILVDIVDCKP
jgi:hypothetical protein